MPPKICKVLLVEDNEAVQELLETVFDDAGYRFRIVSDGPAMRAALADDPDIDVVVIDIGLPGGEDGMTLAEEVAAGGRGVVLSTGSHEHIEALEESGHRYILKPYRVSAFVRLIDDVLATTRRECRRATDFEEKVA
jgi:DNA-binding response OmpR family regulator